MNAVMEEQDNYLASFGRLEKSLGGREPSWLQALRSASIDRFAELGFPTVRDEDWRFTNVTPLARVPFQPGRLVDLDSAARAQVNGLACLADDVNRLVFVNGFLAAGLSALPRLPQGVQADSMARLWRGHPDNIEPFLGQYAVSEGHAFRSLNTAFMRDGAYLRVARGVAVEEPIYVVCVTTGESVVAYPRHLVIAESGSAVTLVEAYVGPGETACLTNAVTEIVVADGAAVDHYKLQREPLSAFHIASLAVHQQRSSRFSSHNIALGAKLARNEVNVVLDALGCECTLNGLYLVAGRQHIDNRTTIDHARPHCASHELYKGILDGKAHGVFNGKIFVRQDAQKTDAKQTNKTLLLSPDATINTKPQLEIYADDVKCTHGATVGQLDPEALFYLRARGIDMGSARNLLTFAFANDIVVRIKVGALRQGLENYLLTARDLPVKEDL